MDLSNVSLLERLFYVQVVYPADVFLDILGYNAIDVVKIRVILTSNSKTD
jgi:hypothetical protein